ncbi:MAG: DNA adenine methylase [Sandaracinobacter sp.]
MESIETASTLTPVDPVRPPAPYAGGKRHLARRISDLVATVPHTVYAEPFVGMGGVFFRRTARPKAEVINDISADVVTLFRILQRHYQSFLDELKWRLSSRAEFKRLTSVDPATLTDLERAARFLYLQRAGFGGKVIGRAFGVDMGQGARFNLTKLVPMLEEVHERLAGVMIEQLPYAEFIAKYGRPGALFYLDPPYWGTEGYYGPHFSRADFEALRASLEASQARWILSINDVPEIRELFAGHRMEEASLKYGLSGGQTDAKELLIMRL